MSEPKSNYAIHFQNASSRLVTGTRRCEHIAPVLCLLHWMPVCQHCHKVATLVHWSLSGNSASYFADDCHLVLFV